ncbi:MAG: hypothetical protein KGH65_02735 [Candidatus Micrarchaeota archaeon]|nr:hypothetical protein [Candidatus Micrarchaeota archaeon]
MASDLNSGVSTPIMEELDSKANSIYVAFSATVGMVNKITTALLLSELKRALTNPGMADHLDKISPYLYTAGFLSLAGREITRENLSALVKILGVAPDESIISLILGANVKSHLVYVYAYYFLLSMGKEVNIEQLEAVLAVLGIPADKERAAESIAFLNKQLGIWE